VSTPIVAFFNNKGGVGKMTLVYHLAWMFTQFEQLARVIGQQVGLVLPTWPMVAASSL
jgi:hypothetical protein